MRISSPSRKTKARKPSHLGSKIQVLPTGNSATRLASMGKTGGLTGSCMPHVISRRASCEAEEGARVRGKETADPLRVRSGQALHYAKTGCPIQAVLWLEWDTTDLDR